MAKEMTETGDGLSLQMNGDYWAEKPPLVMWLIALSYRLFGISEWSARLPAAVFGFLGILLAYLLGAKFFNHWAGLLAGVFLLANPHSLQLSRMAMLDILLAFWMALGLWFFWLGLRKPWYFLLAGVSVGLAVMTKNLVGFLPLVIMAGYLLLVSRWDVFKQFLFWSMFAIAVLIPAPWHLHQIITHGREFTDCYFTYTLFSRAVAPIEGHSGTVFFYAKYVLEHYFAPWLILSTIVLLGFGAGLIRDFKEHKRDPVYFLLVWFLVPAVFFSFIPTKVAGYITPCYLPLALLTAKLSLDHLRRSWFKPVFVLFMAATAAGIATLYPSGILTIDKSPEIKAIAESVRTDGRAVLIYHLPVNAPIYYFDSRIRPVWNAGEADDYLAKDASALLLCQRQDAGMFQDVFAKHHLVLLSESGKGGLALWGLPE